MVCTLERCLFSWKVTDLAHVTVIWDTLHNFYSEWQMSHLFIEIHCARSVCIRFHCAWAVVFTSGWKGTISEDNILWKITFQLPSFFWKVTFKLPGFFLTGNILVTLLFWKVTFQLPFRQCSRIPPRDTPFRLFFKQFNIDRLDFACL